MEQEPVLTANNTIFKEDADTSPIVIYATEDGKLQLDVKLENDTVWLTQQQMAILFERDRTVINRHVRNIFKEGELEESLVCAKFAQSKKYGRREGFSQETEITLYNLDVPKFRRQTVVFFS